MFELFGKRKKVARPLPEVDHPALGRLRGASGVLEGSIEFERGVIAVTINPDGHPIEASLSFAEEVMKHMAALKHRGQDLVVSHAMEAYNSDWRFGERLNGGGVMEMFQKPPKSKAEFCESLALSMVRITGSEVVTLTFTCEEVSSMHHFSVTSCGGVDFNDARMELQPSDAPSVPRQSHSSH
jgi:hypothetical protein